MKSLLRNVNEIALLAKDDFSWPPSTCWKLLKISDYRNLSKAEQFLLGNFASLPNIDHKTEYHNLDFQHAIERIGSKAENGTARSLRLVRRWATNRAWCLIMGIAL